MPHFPKPFFRRSRGLYYVQLRGKQINLGADRVAAFARYHELMTQVPPAVVPSDDVISIIDAFLDWCQQHRAPRTYDWYKERLQSFVESVPATLTVSQLRPFHVQQWADSHSGWNGGMRRGCMLAVQRAFNWAVKLGHIDRSPIAYLEKPKAGTRELVISPELYASLRALITDEAFKDLVTLAWETGARPQELLGLEARHVELHAARLVFPAREAKGKKRVRVVHLTDTAVAIVQRLVKKWPEGRLLRNEDGVPWTRFAVNCRFCRLTNRIGVKLCLYVFRHSFCDRGLKLGVDPITLASLMGHVDATMVARVYSHVGQDQCHLKAALRRATG